MTTPQPNTEESWIKEFEERFCSKKGSTAWAEGWSLLPNEVKSFISSLLQTERQKVVELIKEIIDWPDPQPGAGEGLGPLAGVGMYQQYDFDRQKHKQQMIDLIKRLE